MKEKRTKGRIARWAGAAAGLAVVLLCAAAWQGRVAVAARAARCALDRQGLGDVSFRLAWLSPWRVVVEDVRWGEGAGTLLEVGRVEARFSPGELRRGHVERVHVSGVRTAVVAGAGGIVSPLAERLKAMKGPEGAEGAAGAKGRFSVWMATVKDARVAVRDEGGGTLAEAALEAGGVAEEGGGFRVWGTCGVVADGAVRASGLSVKVTGRVDAETGEWALSPEVAAGDVGALLALARRVSPGLAAGGEVVPTGCSVTARGAFSATAWTNLGPFEASAELGRGGGLAVPSKEAWVRFQSLRAEVSGTPGDVQGRLSAGVAGIGFGKQGEVSQETGRLLSLRASGRLRRGATNEAVTATLESDLPGRTVAQVLPRVLPLVPVFFSEGGTLRAEAGAERAPEGAWRGRVRMEAEARRSSVPVAGAYAGARAVRVAGGAEIEGSALGAVETEIALEEGMYVREGVAVKGGFEARLTARPPYAEAEGTFKGRVDETRALRKLPLALGEGGGVAFEGVAAVTGLASNPVWRLAVKVPEFGAAWTQEAARVTCAVGGGAEVVYGASGAEARGGVWARDVAAEGAAYTAGVGRVEMGFALGAQAARLLEGHGGRAAVSVSNAWARAAGGVELEDAGGGVQMMWTRERGLSFLPGGQEWAWRRLEAQGVKVLPDGVAWSAEEGAVEARFGALVEGSAVRAEARARVPLDAPGKLTLKVSLPETEVGPGDALAALALAKGKAEVSGRVSAEAEVRFLGTQPHVSGVARLAGGRVRAGAAEVEGLAAEVPFVGGVVFRTVEKPFVSFTGARAGNVRFDGGRLDFQVTRRGVFLDRLAVGWCRGSLNAYSVHWDFKAPKDNFVVYADRIDLGEALMMVVPFKGRLEGVLYGRFPVGFDGGRLKLSPGFLYSLPGQGGKLRLDDHRQMQALLDQSGIKGNVQVPLSKALSDLDFSALKFELEPREDGEGTLRIKLDGKSNDKAWPAPVDLNLNLHGPLDELVNMGSSFVH